MAYVLHRTPCCRSKWELKHGKGGGEKKDPFFMKITYLGDGENPVNFLLKKINAFGETYDLDESSINKMTLDGVELTFENLTLSNLGLYGGTYDVYQYNFGDNSEHELIIYSDSLDTLRFSPWYGGPSVSSSNYFKNIIKIEISNNITSICKNAFRDCNNLSEIIFSDTITNVGSGAFNNTKWINNVPDGLIYIGKTAYKYKGRMPDNTHITLLEGTVEITNNAFEGCTGLTSITIPNGLTSIGGYAFQNCTSLTSVTIGNSVTSIGSSAFSGCTSLTSVTIGNSVTSIGDYAFYNCTSLTSITIPNGLTSISNGAFESCTSLTSITIPDSVTSISNGAFRHCIGLTSMVVSSGNSRYDSRNNCNAIIETATNTLISGCKNTTIPSNVTSIGDGAFWDCDSLISIEIPNSVTSIGINAFYDCDSLTSVLIPNNVTSIGNSAFHDCTSLTSVSIGNGVTSIGSLVFYHCSSLASITSLATTAPTILSNTFNGVKTDGTLTVPSGSTGYDVWMQNANYYLGYYNWTKVEQ